MSESGLPSLIVVADDYGITKARNRGILQAIQKGVVTATSIMANGPAALDALALAREHSLLSVVGLHLNLTEGTPLCDPAEIPSLVNHENQLLGKNELRAACAQCTVQVEHVALEVKAQLDWFIEQVGKPPVHLDGHQHCHVIPLLVGTVAAAMHRAQVFFTRIPEEPFALKSLCSVCSCVSVEAAAARSTYSQLGISATESFVGLSFCGASYSATDFACAVRTQLAQRGASSCEAMVHPGLHDPAALDDFGRSKGRPEELQVLCSTELSDQLQGLARLGLRGETGKLLKDHSARGRRFLLFNKRLSTSPRMVIAPSTEQDVCSAIKMAHSPVTVISGGHHYEGWSALDDATVIELSLMNTIEPSADGSMITISAGVLNRDLWHSSRQGTTPFVPTGDCESVSLVGSVLSGGINNFQRQHGMLCDLVHSFRIVLASGEATTVSMETDPELFWALCGGGGGNFGVVLSVTLVVVPAPAQITGVSLAWPVELALDVLQAWSEFAWCTDRRLVLELSVSADSVTAAGVFTGSPEELAQLIASSPLPKSQCEMKPVRADTFWELYHYNDDVAARWKNSGMFLAEPICNKTLLQLLQMLKSPDLNTGNRSVQLSFVPCGGAINGDASKRNAFAWRDHKMSLQIIARWQLAEDDALMMSWVSQARLAVIEGTEETTGYIGWAEGELTRTEAMQWYYGEHAQQLIQVKTRVDPENLFFNPHSIPLSSS